MMKNESTKHQNNNDDDKHFYLNERFACMPEKKTILICTGHVNIVLFILKIVFIFLSVCSKCLYCLYIQRELYIYLVLFYKKVHSKYTSNQMTIQYTLSEPVYYIVNAV